MKYAVTFCALDRETGSNYFWHSCLLLSKWQEGGGKMEVVDQWGFYGVPTTMPNSLLKKVKISLGLDIDLYGNHGMLLHEPMRTLDLGYGLHGATFELTQEQFNLLQLRCQTMADEQNQAIAEVMSQQPLLAKEKEKSRTYPYEDWSAQIYQFEKAKAQKAGREPRLKPFELNLSFTLWGPAVKQSYTCKSQVISLLTGILTNQQINRLTENGKHPTIPRYSGPLEPIFLHSTGPLRQHKKQSGKVVYYRSMEDADVKLYWTLPPQDMDALSQETNEQLQISEDYRNEAKLVIRQLQCLEWLFRNAVLPSQYQAYQTSLIKQITDYYDVFSQVRKINSEPAIEKNWTNYFYFLNSMPRNQGERFLLKNIQQAKLFINTLYMAAVDNWKIDLNCPMENSELITEQLSDATGDVSSYANPIEAVTAYLSTEDKQELCAIIGRTYAHPDTEYDEDSDTDVGIADSCIVR
ncbi:Uncharacterised protein [Legionella beliardensis]|uniref:Uncharacterized protein n=1 Tax=Legionella beliardensis TaxID=91822 RepID=A0A378HZ26_9GAMM|nr:hypothetical protein [Legionella beliardensis]STX28188.1 Uncharacterised protein [Legionella beliardensis]